MESIIKDFILGEVVKETKVIPETKDEKGKVVTEEKVITIKEGRGADLLKRAGFPETVISSSFKAKLYEHLERELEMLVANITETANKVDKGSKEASKKSKENKAVASDIADGI